MSQQLVGKSINEECLELLGKESRILVNLKEAND